ncbi:MAG: ferredoxin [Acutalibacteraceae bacterium]
MTVLLDEEGCIACGTCMEICPEVFKEGTNGKAYVSAEDLPPKAQEKAVQAQEACPVSVIEVV